MPNATGEGSRARDGVSHRPAVPPDGERARLARGFGALLRFERGLARLTQVALAGLAGLHHNTVYLLEAGLRRPSTTSIWRVARALRPREACTLRDAVALDQRLRDTAGPSLRYYGTRAHAAREQARAELLAEAAGAPPATHLDDFGAIVIADLARRRAGTVTTQP